MRVTAHLHESIRTGGMRSVHRASAAVPSRITLELPDQSTCGDLRKAISDKLGCKPHEFLIGRLDTSGQDRFTQDADVEARLLATGDALNNPSKRGVLLCDRFPGPQLERICELQIRRATDGRAGGGSEGTLGERAARASIAAEAIAIAGGATFKPTIAEVSTARDDKAAASGSGRGLTESKEEVEMEACSPRTLSTPRGRGHGKS